MGDVVEVYRQNNGGLYIVWHRDGMPLGGFYALGPIPPAQRPWFRYTSLNELYADFGWLKKDMKFMERLIEWGVI